jgi:putative mRNA 3-end processing factor
VQIAGSVVWCDASRARDLNFVSHAHVPARGAHRKILTTQSTLALLRAAGGAPTGEVLVTPFGRPFSASLLVVEPSGRRIAYAGDVNPVKTLGEAMEVRGADVLVLDAPLAETLGGSGSPNALGSPDAPASPVSIERLPERERMHQALVEGLRRRLGVGQVPVVMAPELGAAQEAIRVIAAAGMPVRAHARVHAFAQAYQELGIALPSVARYTGRLAAGEVLLWPEPRPLPVSLFGMGAEVTVMVLAPRGPTLSDGWLPLSDHADFDAVVRYVLDTGAREVYFTQGYGPAMARALAAHRVRAFPLGPPSQMDLFAAGGTSELT